VKLLFTHSAQRDLVRLREFIAEKIQQLPGQYAGAC